MAESIDVYKAVRGDRETHDGIKIVKVSTNEPLTFIFEGTKQALGAGIFEIPLDFYPMRVGDRFLTYRMFGSGPASRWALLGKLNGCKVNLATMQDPNSLIIDGINKTYTSSELHVPTGLVQGDRVTVAAVYDDGIKYAVLSKVDG